ncbi:glutathione S-transferase N-terminal domain-containing protein [Zavarzinia sp.]|uniref:glutathione S-transferase N-terminal domain-containing protein n=1 Tax=Zavarzinia sp. TaxID=2027920 RepID=UPI003563A49F
MSKLVLRFSPTSPYVRKVMIFALETGLFPRFELHPTNVWAADTDIATTNPLGKVPALTLPHGEVLFDSPVILDYLDHQHGGPRLIPAEGPARWQVLKLQALADGILDAAVACLLEGRRPQELRSAEWIARQKRAVTRGLDALEALASGFGPALDVGQITVMAALGYLDFRFSSDSWRDGRPALAAWFAVAGERPSFLATVPQDPQ